MARPWDISGDDIAGWASRVEASALLPVLIRRLAFATGRLTSLTMRGDGGTRLGGWDGVATVVDGPPMFLPAGTSGWELSVREDVKSKLDEDFDSRSIDADPLIAAQSTYVAVTGRRYTKKLEWAAARQSQNLFANVLCLDADDLATWLELAPSVSRWFATKLGRIVDGVLDLETFVEAWSRRTTPPLPPSLVLLGVDRERAVGTVHNWCSRAVEQSRVLQIQADTRDEAVLFAASCFLSSGQRDHWLSRSVIVESRESLRALVGESGSEDLLLIPHFDDAAEEIGHFKGRTILPLASGADKESAVVLDSIPYSLIARSLGDATMNVARAEAVARDSGGKLSVLQRLLGYPAAPKWLQLSELQALTPMLFIGEWRPKNESDREAVNRLGVNADDLEAVCTRLSACPDAPIEIDSSRWHGPSFRWASPRDAWRALCAGVPATAIRNAVSVAVDILGEGDPRFAMPKEERFLAAIRQKTLRHSGPLRRGFARTLVMLTVLDDELSRVLGVRGGQTLADAAVRQLLTPDWQRWASLSDVLRLLAEAAPRAFLDALETSLGRGPDGAARLLNEATDMGGSPHVELLWALEGLAYRADCWRRVAEVLTDLASADIAGSHANHPYRSLAKMLHPILPGSTTTVAERIQTVERALSRRPAIGWRLALDMVPDMMGGLVFPSHYPEFNIPPGTRAHTQQVCDDDYLKQIDATLALLIQNVGVDLDRWLSLIGEALRSDVDIETRVLTALETNRDNVADPNGALWAKIREALAWRIRLASTNPSKSRPIELLERLYRHFEPTDSARAIEWLFRLNPEFPHKAPDDFREREAFAEQRRVAWLESSAQGDAGWALVGRVAEMIAHGTPWLLGKAIAHCSFAEEAEVRLLREASPSHSSIFASFMWWRGERNGQEWLYSVLDEVVRQQRIHEAVQLAIVMPQGQAHWERIERLGREIADAFWAAVNLWSRDFSSEELDHGVRRLLDRDRIAAAADAAVLHGKALLPSTALHILEAIRRDPSKFVKPDSGGSTTHTIIELFVALDRDAQLDEERLAQLEGFFFQVLRNSNRRLVLYRRLSKSPELFCGIIETLWKRAGAAREPDSDDGVRQQQVEAGFAILESWKGFPGDDLEGTERDEVMLKWALEVIDRTRAAGRGGVGLSQLARVLARAPSASDGLWPCIAARQLLHMLKDSTLSDDAAEHPTGQRSRFMSGLETAKKNLRGATMRPAGEGGTLERAEAQKYRSSAEQLKTSWPDTADLLNALADCYLAEADEEDRDARTNRTREGFDRPRPNSETMVN